MKPPADRAWVVASGWMVFLHAYRLELAMAGTWHYFAGREVAKIGAVFKTMSRLRREKRADWFEASSAATYFERQGELLWLKDEHYRSPSTSLLTDGDLALVFSAIEGPREIRIPIDAKLLRTLGVLFPELAPHRPAAALAEDPEALALAEALREDGLLAEVPLVPSEGDAEGANRAERSRSQRGEAMAVRLHGHGSVEVATARTRVWIDPLLTVRFRSDAQRLDELTRPPDAVILTHAHWSHFNVDTLLRIDRRTPVYLPARRHAVSLDNIDMPAILGELGFHDLRFLPMWEPVTIGEIRVTATPFRGAGLGPASPVDWATLHVAAGGRAFFFAVDACADQHGSMDEVIADVGRRLGAVDALFASYEAYQYPICWFTRRPFVLGPGRELASTSPEDAVRWATMLGARTLVPYAGFAFDEATMWTAPPKEMLYAGVVRRGSLRDLVESAAGWPEERLTLLAPGGVIRWDGAEVTVTGRAAVPPP